jgi:hypothetical protein
LPAPAAAGSPRAAVVEIPDDDDDVPPPGWDQWTQEWLGFLGKAKLTFNFIDLLIFYV